MINTSDDHSEDNQCHSKHLDKLTKESKTSDISLSSGDGRKPVASIKSDVPVFRAPFFLTVASQQQHQSD